MPSCTAPRHMNNVKVQNIKKQEQKEARLSFLSTHRNHFFDQNVELQRGIAKKCKQEFNRTSKIYSSNKCFAAILYVRVGVWGV